MKRQICHDQHHARVHMPLHDAYKGLITLYAINQLFLAGMGMGGVHMVADTGPGH